MNDTTKTGTSQPGNSDSFAEAAGHLLSGGVNFRAGLEQARHDHSWTTVADQYIKLYSDSAS